MDVTIEDLQRVIQLSLAHAMNQQLSSQQILLHHFYTNGRHGPKWSVRRIIDESCSSDSTNNMVIYRVVKAIDLILRIVAVEKSLLAGHPEKFFPTKKIET